MKRAFYFLCFIFNFSFFLCGCSVRPYHSDTRLIMGTVFDIIAQDEEAIKKAFREIERIDSLMSDYKPDSEISRLNRDGRVKASPETIVVFRAAKKIYNLSGGAFDVTVGPLVKLWNIKANMAKDASLVKLPTEEKIKQALSCVSSDFIEIDEKNRIIKLKKRGVSVDLGAIARGYAVDRAIKTLKKCGVRNALVNAGGETYCLGAKGFLAPWRVGIKAPRNDNTANIFTLKNKAVSTSGGYEQFFVYNNKRYARIIDPRTGHPVDNGVISVTVVTDNGLTADALSTAIFVLGKEKGGQFARRFKNVRVRIITR